MPLAECQMPEEQKKMVERREIVSGGEDDAKGLSIPGHVHESFE